MALVPLAGCLRNVGGKCIKAREQGDIQVALPELCCCAFECFADELDSEQWQQLTQAPVRFVVDLFKKSGLDRPFTDPWGRSFSQGGKPALPAMADKLYFQARVPSAGIEQLLKLSGHNKVYVTPRRMDRTVLDTFSVVWLGACRADTLRTSLQVPCQVGIARAKNKYGLRIPSTCFAEVFACGRGMLSRPRFPSASFTSLAHCRQKLVPRPSGHGPRRQDGTSE